MSVLYDVFVESKDFSFLRGPFAIKNRSNQNVCFFAAGVRLAASLGRPFSRIIFPVKSLYIYPVSLRYSRRDDRS